MILARALPLLAALLLLVEALAVLASAPPGRPADGTPPESRSTCDVPGLMELRV